MTLTSDFLFAGPHPAVPRILGGLGTFMCRTLKSVFLIMSSSPAWAMRSSVSRKDFL